MLLVRVWGMGTCFYLGFMRLGHDLILWKNSATPQLLRSQESAVGFGVLLLDTPGWPQAVGCQATA